MVNYSETKPSLNFPTRMHHQPPLRLAAAFLFVPILILQNLPAKPPVAADPDNAPPQLISTTEGAGARYDTPEKLRAAADAGDPEACLRLAEDLLETAAANPASANQAVALLQKAAAAQHPAASFRLARLYDHGEFVPEAPARSRELYLVAAKTGHVEAQYNLGVLLARGRGGPKEYTEALAWLILATQAGASGDAEPKLRAFLKPHKDSASIFAAAEIRAQSLKAALVPYSPKSPAASTASGAQRTRPATKIDPKNPSATKLTSATPLIPQTYTPPPPQDPGPAIKLFSPTGRLIQWLGLETLERAVAAGDPNAHADLGQILLAGKITTSEPLRAIVLLEKGAQLGSNDAAYQLAEIYKNGEHQVKDLNKSFLFYRQAALGGSPVAMFNVGAMLTSGQGVQPNLTEALSWLTVAKKFGVNRGFDAKLRAQLDKNSPGESAKSDALAAQLEAQIRANRAASKTSGN